MVSSSHLEILYRYVTYTNQVGRSSMTDFHKECFPTKRKKTLASIIKRYEDRVYFRPRLFVLQDVTVETINYDGKLAYQALEDSKRDYDVFDSMALVGSYSLLSFKRVKKNETSSEMLTYAESVIPTYPSSRSITDIDPSRYEAEQLPVMKKPKWDDLDWGIYNKMNDPNEASTKAAKALAISHKTVLSRFYDIQKECTIWMPFFPNEYENYNQFIVQLKTEYEIGFKNELSTLDRSSYIYKVGNSLLLHLFLEKNIDLDFLLDLEKKGLIHSYSVSIPLRYSNRFY